MRVKINPRRMSSVAGEVIRESHRRGKKEPRAARWARQRAERGFSDADCWSLDHYLATIIAGALRQLRKASAGYPADLTKERWDAILAKMTRGFEAVDQHLFDPGLTEEEQRQFRRSMQLFRRWFFDLWW